MSQDPERLLSMRSLDPDQRIVLRAGLDVDPPSGAKDEIWSVIAAKLPPGGGGPGSGLEGALWKKVAIGFAMGLVGMGAAELASRATGSPLETAVIRSPRADRPALALTPTSPRAAPEPQPQPVRGQRPTLAPLSALPPAQPVASAPEDSLDPVRKRKSQLEDESRMLREARSALQSGNSSGALAFLGESQKQHPKLILAQEHEALTIDAFVSSGNQAAAQRRARRFLEVYPTSPHAEKMRKIAGAPQSP